MSGFFERDCLLRKKLMEILKNELEMKHNPVVNRDEWLSARLELLEKEKELTRMRDRLSAERRKLPWMKIEKPYEFESPMGKQTLLNLFDGRSQLIIKHFMFGQGWKEGCVGCSFEVDHMMGALVHLNNHDVSYVAVSRAPIAEIEPFRRRMGWDFKWVSSFGSDFNYDFNVSARPEEIEKGEVYYNYKMQEFQIDEMSGLSVFYKDPSGNIFHTYSTYGRGAEEILSTYVCLDLTPKGRNETGPYFSLTDWVRHHDRYGDSGFVASTGRYVPAEEGRDSCCGSMNTKQ